MDVTRLRRLLKEVDDEHRDTMSSAVDGLAELAYRGDRSPSRRSFLKGGIVAAGGSALVIGPLAGSAMAADTTTTTVAATTTTAPPRAPQSADLELLGYAQSLELAAAEVYTQAVSSGRLSPATIEVARAFRRHHIDHAEAIGALAGKRALGLKNKSVVDTFGGRALRANDEAGVLTVAYDLENAVCATYAYAISTVQGTHPAAVLASILPIEGRHAVLLGDAIGKSVTDMIPLFQTTNIASGLDPAKNPIEG